MEEMPNRPALHYIRATYEWSHNNSVIYVKLSKVILTCILVDVPCTVIMCYLARPIRLLSVPRQWSSLRGIVPKTPAISNTMIVVQTEMLTVATKALVTICFILKGQGIHLRYLNHYNIFNTWNPTYTTIQLYQTNISNYSSTFGPKSVGVISTYV